MPQSAKPCRSKAKNQQMNMIQLLNLSLSRAETEPRDGLSLAQLSNATTSQVTATAPSAVSPDHIKATSSANGSREVVSEPLSSRV